MAAAAAAADAAVVFVVVAPELNKFDEPTRGISAENTVEGLCISSL